MTTHQKIATVYNIFAHLIDQTCEWMEPSLDYKNIFILKNIELVTITQNRIMNRRDYPIIMGFQPILDSTSYYNNRSVHIPYIPYRWTTKEEFISIIHEKPKLTLTHVIEGKHLLYIDGQILFWFKFKYEHELV